MALSQDQWFQRLKTWVPSWFLIEQKRNIAFLQALAMIFASIQDEVDDQISKTFIGEAEGEWLDTHGQERSVTRNPNEEDSEYRVRIVSQSLLSRCALPSIKSVVDELLSIGPCNIIEDYNGGTYASREYYASRNAVLIDQILNAFTIVVPPQVHAPYSFYSRGYYADRSDFIGSETVADGVYDGVIRAVDEIKAYGVLYRIIETRNATYF